MTDVLVRRGDTAVVRSVAENHSRAAVRRGFSRLVDSAEKDGALAEKVGLRPDIPPRLFRDLLLKATEVVQQRLFASAKPETQAEIRRVLAKVSDRGRRQVGAARLFGRAADGRGAAPGRQARRGGAGRLRPAGAARGNRRCARIAVRGADRGRGPADVRRTAGPDPDPLQGGRLGLADRQGDHLGAHGGKGASSQALDNAYTNFERLSPATAQRVMRFWQVRR